MDRPAAPLLILGSTGRIGRAFRMLWRRGLWPGAVEPLWHHRPGHAIGGNAIAWDLAGPPPADPRLGAVRGIVVLAGATGGDAAQLGANTAAALAALSLAAAGVRGPVLLMSSAAVVAGAAGIPDDTAPPAPLGAYGASKAAMERAVAGRPGVTCLRLANVAGCGALFAAMAAGEVALDRFADGSSPRRAWIGPVSLARVLVALAGRDDLPAILNTAQPGTVPMEDILAAAGARWHPVPAPPDALARLELDTGLLESLVPLPRAAASALVAEARAAGWTLGGGTP
ncbi:MAG: sugar nucleotide-binding protein [Rubellimicrobium sp.]|nr:sugar nucleotide-binding protein [Rubellimicrobium sp.]